MEVEYSKYDQTGRCGRNYNKSKEILLFTYTINICVASYVFSYELILCGLQSKSNEPIARECEVYGLPTSLAWFNVDVSRNNTKVVKVIGAWKLVLCGLHTLYPICS